MLTRKPEIGQILTYDRDGESYKVTSMQDDIAYLMSMETGQRTSMIWQFKDKLNECFSEPNLAPCPQCGDSLELFHGLYSHASNMACPLAMAIDEKGFEEIQEWNNANV